MKKNNFILIISIFLVGKVTFTSAQSVAPTVVNAAGGSGNLGSYIIDYSVGETSIETGSNGKLIVTQGFLQGESTTVGVQERTSEGIQVNTFPNPTIEEVNVRIYSDQDAEFSYALMDTEGKKVKKGDSCTKKESTISLVNLAAGTYYLKLYIKTSRGTNFTQLNKIQKIN